MLIAPRPSRRGIGMRPSMTRFPAHVAESTKSLWDFGVQLWVLFPLPAVTGLRLVCISIHLGYSLRGRMARTR